MFETKWFSGMLEMAACRWTCEGSIQGHRVVLCVWYLWRLGVISINVDQR